MREKTEEKQVFKAVLSKNGFERIEEDLYRKGNIEILIGPDYKSFVVTSYGGRKEYNEVNIEYMIGKLYITGVIS